MSSKTFAGEMFEPTVHGIPHLRTEAAARHVGLACEKLAVQPRRARCGDLLLQVKVRADREREPLPALGVLIGARLDDCSGDGITRQFKVSELKMVRPAVDPLDDRIGRTFQFVMQTTLRQSAEHGFTGVVAMEGKAGDVGLAAGPTHDPVHRLDNIATNPEFAKPLFKARLQCPAGRGDPFGKAEAPELGSSAEHEAAKLTIPMRRART